MKRLIFYIYLVCSIFSSIAFSSCKKYLDAKSNSSLATPSSLSDLQAILDNVGEMNNSITLNHNGSDEYYMTYTDWLSRNQFIKDCYVWNPQTVPAVGGSDDWISQYTIVFDANTVLDELKNIPPEGQEQEWKNIKGEALFFRAYTFFELAQIYSLQYDAASSTTDLGIVLRLSSDYNEVSKRASVQQTYDQIINDAQESLIYLSSETLPTTPERKTRPCKPAAFGLLARAYLQIGDYDKAKANADSCLHIYNTLMDFNTITAPIQIFNPEVIFYNNTNNTSTLSSRARIDTTLYGSYESNDLRKSIFFTLNSNGSYGFNGSYNGPGNIFTGIATDEMYLIRAEAAARLNNTSDALNDLNLLLSKRYDGTFIPLTAADADEALTLILKERRKELIYRGFRWSDLKRLNKDSRFADTLKRDLNGEIVTLPPNDLRYAWLLSPTVIQRSGLQQSLR